MKRRIAVTGIGLITLLGIGYKETWDAASEGRSGVRTIERFNHSDHTTKIAGVITNLNPEDFMNPKHAIKTVKLIPYAVSIT